MKCWNIYVFFKKFLKVFQRAFLLVTPKKNCPFKNKQGYVYVLMSSIKKYIKSTGVYINRSIF